MYAKSMPSRAAWSATLLVWLLVWLAPAQAQPHPASTDSPMVEELVGNIEPDNLIRVRVSGLAGWAEGGRRSVWRLVPYVDGRPIVGIYPIGASVREGWLQFHLQVTDANEDAWIDLLSPPTFERFVPFSVGLEQEEPFASRYHPSAGELARVVVIEQGWAATAVGLVLLCGLGFGYLALHTRLLFDPPAPGARNPRPRLSLAKVQFALWFFAVFSAFLLIWLTTGRLDSLNSSIVATMGISSGTALGESLLRGTHTSEATTPSHPIGPEAQPPGIGVLLRDLACDANGASIYRFQVLAWTIVLLVTFASKVYFDLAMPVFGSELLYLLGLSSGTYVAYGLPSARKADGPIPPHPVPAPDVPAHPPPHQVAAPNLSPNPSPMASPTPDSGSRLSQLASRLRAGEEGRPGPPS